MKSTGHRKINTKKKKKERKTLIQSLQETSLTYWHKQKGHKSNKDILELSNTTEQMDLTNV